MSGLQRVTQATGIPSAAIASSADYQMGAMDMTNAQDADIKFFDKLGVAVIKGGVEQLAKLASLASDETEVMAVVPERFVFPSDGLSVPIPGQPTDGGGGGGPGGDPSALPDYLQGKIDALQEVLKNLKSSAKGRAVVAELAATLPFQDDAQSTWGLKAITRALSMGNTGQGIKVAILDTGIDLNHPDFAGRLNPANCLGFVNERAINDAQDVTGTERTSRERRAGTGSRSPTRSMDGGMGWPRGPNCSSAGSSRTRPTRTSSRGSPGR